MIVKFDGFLISRILNRDFCIPVCFLEDRMPKKSRKTALISYRESLL